MPPERIEPQSLNDYLEAMSKSAFQTGMSRKVIDSKWPSTREAFQNFDIHLVAKLAEKDIDDLTRDARVIRNRRKLSAIVFNARKIIELDEKHGTFQQYLQAHEGFDSTLKAIRTDFKFMGPTGIYLFLYSVGEEVIPPAEFEKQYRK